MSEQGWREFLVADGAASVLTWAYEHRVGVMPSIRPARAGIVRPCIEPERGALTSPAKHAQIRGRRRLDPR
jgi:hypothetical protein